MTNNTESHLAICLPYQNKHDRAKHNAESKEQRSSTEGKKAKLCCVLTVGYEEESLLLEDSSNYKHIHMKVVSVIFVLVELKLRKKYSFTTIFVSYKKVAFLKESVCGLLFKASGPSHMLYGTDWCQTSFFIILAMVVGNQAKQRPLCHITLCPNHTPNPDYNSFTQLLFELIWKLLLAASTTAAGCVLNWDHGRNEHRNTALKGAQLSKSHHTWEFALLKIV